MKYVFVFLEVFGFFSVIETAGFGRLHFLFLDCE